jgi:hypothetical protein
MWLHFKNYIFAHCIINKTNESLFFFQVRKSFFVCRSFLVLRTIFCTLYFLDTTPQYHLMHHTFTHTTDSLWQHCFDYFAHNQSLFYLCIEFILEILLLTLEAYLHKTVLILQYLCFIRCIK